MALALNGLLAVALCANVRATPATWRGDDNDVSLLQKDLHLDADLQRAESRPQNKPVPEVFVNLDAAPEERWHNVTRYYTDLGIYPKLFQVSKDDIMPEGKALLKTLKVDEVHMRELRGIVADLSHIINDPEAALDAIVLLQMGYELSGYSEGNSGVAGFFPSLFSQQTLVHTIGKMAKRTGCSGLLAAMPNGTVVHVRNMDYGNFEVEVEGRKLRWPEVTIDVTFLRSGKPFITATLWPGSIGFHTAMRHGGWSFEQNTRFHSLESSYIWGFRGSLGYQLEVRKIMEKFAEFEIAVHKLRELNLMAPGYFVVAGPRPWQGAVITLDRGGAHEPRTPPVMRLGSVGPFLQAWMAWLGQAYTGKWHIIQTNDDQGGLAFDSRRAAGELSLAASSQKMVSVDWALALMSKPPLYNAGTVFTTVYVPNWDYHRTYAHPGQWR